MRVPEREWLPGFTRVYKSSTIVHQSHSEIGVLLEKVFTFLDAFLKAARKKQDLCTLAAKEQRGRINRKRTVDMAQSFVISALE